MKLEDVALHKGKKVLVTTDSWFMAPNGMQYKAVHGTVHGVVYAKELLGGVEPSRSTNWYLQIGDLTIAGCQVHYAIQADQVELKKSVYHHFEYGKLTTGRGPSMIYDADASSVKSCAVIQASDEFIQALVKRFLSWQLPEDLQADSCVCTAGPDRSGTNLLSYSEAELMLKHVLDIHPR